MERHDAPGMVPRHCRRCGALALAGTRYCAMCGRALARPGARRSLLLAGLAWLLALGLLAASQRLADPRRSAAPPSLAASPAPTPSPAASSTPTPSPPPTLGADGATFSRTLLDEPFEQAERSALETGEADGARYALERGAYVITVDRANQIAWSPLNGRYTDIAAQVDVTFDPPLSDTAAGLLFRYQDASNFYFFNISADGHYALDMLKDGSWSPLIDWAESPEIRRTGTANRLRVELAGDQISLYVNGRLLDQTSDTTFGGGRVALAVNTFAQGGATVAFDNLLLQGSQ